MVLVNWLTVPFNLCTSIVVYSLEEWDQPTEYYFKSFTFIDQIPDKSRFILQWKFVAILTIRRYWFHIHVIIWVVIMKLCIFAISGWWIYFRTCMAVKWFCMHLSICVDVFVLCRKYMLYAAQIKWFFYVNVISVNRA